MLFATIFYIGCGEDTEEEMMKEEEMVIEITPLEKAQAAIGRVDEKRNETHKKAGEAGDYSTIFTAAQGIYQSELGFGEVVWQKLLDTWEDAHNERVQSLFQAGKRDESKAEVQEYGKFLSYYLQKFDFETMSGGEYFFEYMSAYDEIVVEYLRLSYEYPDHTQERLLSLLRNSMVNGNVSIQYPEEYPD